MFVLGIVGSIAGGKSTVSAYLESRGVTWIDADKIAQSLLDDGEVIAALTGHFGGEVESGDGSVDRAKLAKFVFGDDDLTRAGLLYLEGLIHPRVRKEIHCILRNFDSSKLPIVLLDIPLLFESNWHYSCDSIWCVDAPQKLRIDRIQNRNWNAQELFNRESNQLDVSTKRRLSNRVIENDSTIIHLHQLIESHFSKLLIEVKRIDPTDHHCQPNTA